MYSRCGLVDGAGMKKNIILVIMCVLFGCASQEMIRVRHLDIKDVDVSSMQDGEYTGSFSYCGFEYAVATIIKNHKIDDIRMLRNRDSRHAKRAQAVLSEIIRRQTPNVDAVSGATTTSKAIMKAVENSLNSK
jgi:uncharacterized protein with FMN-binding domain